MKSILRRILAAFICAILMTAPVAFAQSDENQGDINLPNEDFTGEDYTGEDNTEDGGDVNPPGAGDPVTGPSPTPLSASNVQATGTAKDITKKSKAKVSEGNAQLLADRKVSTTWTTKKAGAKLEVKFESPASGLYIEWGKECTSFTLSELDGSQNVISTRSESDTFPCLKTYFEISPEAKGFRLEFPNAGESIAEIYVLSGGLPSSDKQMWEAPHENAELLVLASNYGDEFVYFGGVLPYYQIEKNIPTQVVFVCDTGRQVKEQALAALWAAGIRNYPIFLDYPYKQGLTLSDVVSKWGEEKTVVDFVSLIRRLKPSVIVSNDPKGEKNDGARAAVSQYVQQAVNNAADSEYDPISYSAYGGWKVSKLYLHLSDQNPITMDWSKSSVALNNASSLGVAKNAYAKYTSLTGTNPFQDGGQYDNSKFGLVYTDVGADEIGGDFFENVAVTGGLSDDTELDDDVNRWDDNLPEENLETLNEMLTPPTDPDPTPEPTPEPSPTPAPSGFSMRGDLRALRVFLIILLVLALLVAGGLAANMILKKRGIDLQLYRRINRVLHGKSFRLPKGKSNKVYRDEPEDKNDEDNIY